MGTDKALGTGGTRREKHEMGLTEAPPERESGQAAKVVELLPNSTVKVELESRAQVLAHFAGALKRNFVRVRVGDRVLVELTPHDQTRGRIMKLLPKP